MRISTLAALVVAPILFLAAPGQSADAQFYGNRCGPGFQSNYFYGGGGYCAPPRAFRQFRHCGPRRFVNRFHRPTYRRFSYSYSYPRYRTYRRGYRCW